MKIKKLNKKEFIDKAVNIKHFIGTSYQDIDNTIKFLNSPLNKVMKPQDTRKVNKINNYQIVFDIDNGENSRYSFESKTNFYQLNNYLIASSEWCNVIYSL